MENKTSWKVYLQMYYPMHNNQVRKFLFDTYHHTNLELKTPPSLNNALIFTLKKRN